MERYQDYVIKDGVLVGRFEEMYQRFDDPWHQSEAQCHRLSKSRNVAILNLLKYGLGSVVEFGCGLGHFSKMIHEAGCNVTGIDISATAIAKAKERYPKIPFVVDSVSNIDRYREADAILFAEITWYILADLPAVFDRMLRGFQGKYFLQNLVFYKGNAQQYGKEHFQTLDEFIAYCPFELIESATSTTNDPASAIETSAIFRVPS